MQSVFYSEHPVLLAISNDVQLELLQNYLTNLQISWRSASTYDGAVHLLKMNTFAGIILTSDLAVADSVVLKPGLVTLVRTKVPTITIMLRVREHFERIEEIYIPPLHEYCRLGNDDAAGIEIWMQHAGMIQLRGSLPT